MNQTNCLITIKDNMISNVTTAIVYANNNVLTSDETRIVWNAITNVENGFDFNLSGESAIIYVRFNNVQYTHLGATVHDNQVDLTFNYWGSETLDSEDFVGVENKYLLENYTSEETILTEASYDPTKPLSIIITNPTE